MSRKYKRGLMVPNEREQEMHDYLFLEGHTLQECGDKFGITRERVRQIIESRYGITNNSNGPKWAKSIMSAYSKVRNNIEKSRKIRESMIHSYFGCHEEIVTHINGEPFNWTKEGMKSLAMEYIQQKRNALRRGISWNINFREWWGVWDESGKYNQRGRHKGQYVVARWGDSGAYELDNVYICKAEDNIKDIYKNKTDDEIIEIRLRQRRSPLNHCKRGHELIGDNLYVWSKNGSRHCKACDKMRKKIAYDQSHDITLAQATA